MEHFWNRVDRGEDCWLWTGATNQDGYGNVWWNGRCDKAHRVAFELTNGPIPAGLYVLHSCDNPACVNPAHLRTGTQYDNMRDMSARGRYEKAKHTRPKVLGVYRNRTSWKASFKVPGGPQLDKYFRSFDDAVAQRRAWEVEHLSQRPGVEVTECCSKS